MRVLLIENDRAHAPAIELMLKAEDFNVYTTDEGTEGVELAMLYDYDAIVLSTTPDRTDIDMIRAIRISRSKAAIVALTSMPSIEHTVRALGSGADDVIAKPFHKDDLIARILATTRRSKGHAQSTITVGDLVVNLGSKTVEVAGNRVHLTNKEYLMLELLALRKNCTISKEMFLNHLYGGLEAPSIKIIDVFICKLRKKLDDASEGRSFFETVWGRGYVLRDPDTAKAGAPMTSNPVGRQMDGIDFPQMLSA